MTRIPALHADFFKFVEATLRMFDWAQVPHQVVAGYFTLVQGTYEAETRVDPFI